jgi:hypothetical protein
MRALTILSLILAGPAGLAAQAAAPLCYHARPKAACSAYVFTDFGAYVILGSDGWGNAPWREVGDWGAMGNIGSRDAVGGSVFATFDRAGLLVGPSVRYRHWLSSSRAVDIAVGTPLYSSTGNILSGSVVGLARYSPNDWMAVAVRPEVLRWTTVTSCGPVGCATATRPHARLSLGIELGRVPGLVLTIVSGLATLVAGLGIAASGD